MNDEDVLQRNLAASAALRSGEIQAVFGRRECSASAAYNRILRETDAEYVILVHQDVYLPRGWVQRVILGIEDLEKRGVPWGILGVFGVRDEGGTVGRVWSNGLGVELRGSVHVPASVCSVDEVVIVVRRETGLRFDEALPGFHLYGTDIVQAALTAGYEAWVLDAPVVHNSLPVQQLSNQYLSAYRYLRRKYRDRLPLNTCIAPISRSPAPLWRTRSRIWMRRVRGECRHVERAANPAEIARRLGYEQSETAGEMDG